MKSTNQTPGIVMEVDYLENGFVVRNPRTGQGRGFVITKAEHAALNAVAEAAKKLTSNPECKCYPPDDLNSCNYCSAWGRLESALANLANP